MLIGAAPLLGACHATAGAGEDISATGQALTNSAEKHTPEAPTRPGRPLRSLLTIERRPRPATRCQGSDLPGLARPSTASASTSACNSSWGYFPSSGFGTALVVILALMFVGII
jgi:predicted small secreted protein